MTDFRPWPESPVTIPESAVTLGRNEAEFALELTFSWLCCPIFWSGEADASQTECHAQDQRRSAPQVRGAPQPREDRSGDRPVERRGDEHRAASGAEGPELAITGGTGRQSPGGDAVSTGSATPRVRAARLCADAPGAQAQGRELQLLWEEYEAAHGEQAYRYSQFCAHYHEYRRTLARSMRQVHRAGEKVFIDYSGDTVAVIDPKNGEILTAEIFVATLGASKYAYAEATWTQTLPDWIGSTIRMLEFFGAVPSLWIPDNLKAAIKKACRYEPEATATYEDCARCCWLLRTAYFWR